MVPGEDPVQLVLRGDVEESQRSVSRATAFVIGQPEGPVLDRRPTRDEPELVLPQWILLGAGQVVEEGARVQRVIAQEVEHGAVQLVGAGLAHDVDLVGAEAVLGRIRGGLLLEFLNGVNRQNDRRGAQRRVGVGSAVEQEVVGSRPGAVDTDGSTSVPTHRALLAPSLHRSVAEEKQLQETAPVERKLGDLLLADRVAYGSSFRIDRRGDRGHLDRLGDLADDHVEVDAQGLIDVQPDVRPAGLLKAFQVRLDGVESDRQERKRVVAALVRRGFPGQAGFLADDGDVRAGHDRPAGVGEGSVDLARRRLGMRYAREEYGRKQPYRKKPL